VNTCTVPTAAVETLTITSVFMMVSPSPSMRVKPLQSYQRAGAVSSPPAWSEMTGSAPNTSVRIGTMRAALSCMVTSATVLPSSANASMCTVPTPMRAAVSTSCACVGVGAGVVAVVGLAVGVDGVPPAPPHAVRVSVRAASGTSRAAGVRMGGSLRYLHDA
jgi:hypothetical protein